MKAILILLVSVGLLSCSVEYQESDLYQIEFTFPNNTTTTVFVWGVSEYDVQKHIENPTEAIKGKLPENYITYSVAPAKILNRRFRYTPVQIKQ